MPLAGPFPMWQQARPDRYALGVDEVHLWLLSLDSPPLPCDGLVAMLDANERDRAARFKFDRDRRRFEVGHGLMRSVLAAYAGEAGDKLRFEPGPYGKPSLVGGASAPLLAFNLSHSGGWALLGVTAGVSIGVDLESLRPMPDCIDIARQNFTTNELAGLLRLPMALREHRFFALWVHKEAYVKGLGGGLSIALDAFEIELAPGGVAQLLRSGERSR